MLSEMDRSKPPSAAVKESDMVKTRKTDRQNRFRAGEYYFALHIGGTQLVKSGTKTPFELIAPDCTGWA